MRQSIQQTMNCTLHATPGGGTHTRWFDNEHHVGTVADSLQHNQTYNENSCNKNFVIAYKLLMKSLYYKEQGDWVRCGVYYNAADSIAKLDYPVTCGDELASGEKKVRGIGKGIARLIDEYLNNEHRVGTVADSLQHNQTYNENSCNKNFVIAYKLLMKSLYYKEQGDWVRCGVYYNAADSIAKLDYPVTCGDELASGEKKVRGIGKGIARLIDEYLMV